MKTEKLRGVAGGEDDVAGWLVTERRSLDILPVKKEAKLSASEVPGEVVSARRGTYTTSPDQIDGMKLEI